MREKGRREKGRRDKRGRGRGREREKEKKKKRRRHTVWENGSSHSYGGGVELSRRTRIIVPLYTPYTRAHTNQHCHPYSELAPHGIAAKQLKEFWKPFSTRYFFSVKKNFLWERA
jgi:hypothetical protein